MSRRLLIIGVLIFAVLFVAQIAFAQDSPNFPPVDVESDAATLLDVLLTSILGAAIASPFVATLVGIVKLIPAANDLGGELLTTIVAVVVYVLAALATHFSLGDQFYRLIDALQVILPVLLTLIGAPAVYHQARKVNAPIIGYQRTGEYASERGAA